MLTQTTRHTIDVMSLPKHIYTYFHCICLQYSREIHVNPSGHDWNLFEVRTAFNKPVASERLLSPTRLTKVLEQL